MTEANYHNRREEAFKNAGSLISPREILARRPKLEGLWEAAHSSFAVKVTRVFGKKINWQNDRDPIGLQVLPSAEELEALHGGLQDPVGDRTCSPLPWVVHKYPNRILLMVTKQCHLHCRYCFRRTYAPGTRPEPTEEEFQAAVAYVAKHQPNEVILSGGDPLALSDRKLLKWVRAIRPHCEQVRIHTRAVVTAPDRVTEDLCSALAEVGSVWLAIHCNHRIEVDEHVRASIKRIADAGIPLLNQTVLLKGVNDDPEVLVELFQLLTSLRIRPYYLHHPDFVAGATHFWVEPTQGLKIFRQIQGRLSGLACPRYVIDPSDGSGKVSVADWLRAGGGSRECPEGGLPGNERPMG